MAYTCPHCGAVSQHPQDAAERYCARCRMFEDEARSDPDELAARRVAVRDKLIAMVTGILELAADSQAVPPETLQLLGRAAGLLQGAATGLDRLTLPKPPP